MNATITYKLSAAGQKASILAGGTGAAKQEMRVDSTDPLFPELVNVATVLSDGTIQFDCEGRCCRESEYVYLPEFDAPPTLAEILAANTKAIADAKAAKVIEAQEKEERRLARLAKDFERVTEWAAKPVEERISKASGTWKAAPLYLDENESKAAWETSALYLWTVQHAADRQAAQVIEDAKAAAEKEEKRLAFRASRNLEDGDISLNIEDGALSQVPAGCWTSHKRGKNWLAVIEPNASKPGGLERDFQEKAKGDCYYMAGGLSVGDAIEFGADDYSGSGRKSPERWYGYVKRIEAKYIVVVSATTGKAAHKAAQKFMEKHVEVAATV